LRLSSFGGYGLALAALALVVFAAYDSYPALLLALGQFSANKSDFPTDQCAEVIRAHLHTTLQNALRVNRWL